MTTETKFKGVEEILDELIAQAKDGSCKTCQWCVPCSGLEEYHITHYCMIQGNVNPIHFTDADLERQSYPWKCEEGQWHEEENGLMTREVYGCLAYEENLDQIIMLMVLKEDPDSQDVHRLVENHRKYMDCLKEAAVIHYALKNVRLDDLLRRLNTGDFSHYYPWEK